MEEDCSQTKEAGTKSNEDSRDLADETKLLKPPEESEFMRNIGAGSNESEFEDARQPHRLETDATFHINSVQQDLMNPRSLIDDQD